MSMQLSGKVSGKVVALDDYKAYLAAIECEKYMKEHGKDPIAASFELNPIPEYL